jgi:hypothetical protein
VTVAVVMTGMCRRDRRLVVVMVMVTVAMTISMVVVTMSHPVAGVILVPATVPVTPPLAEAVAILTSGVGVVVIAAASAESQRLANALLSTMAVPLVASLPFARRRCRAGGLFR